MDENYQELKEGVDFLFAIPEVIEKSKADGHIDLSDLQYGLGLYTKAKAGIEGIGNPAKRFKDLPREDRRNLITYAQQKFDLKNDGLEELIERWFEWVYLTGELVTDSIAMAKPAGQA